MLSYTRQILSKSFIKSRCLTIGRRFRLLRLPNRFDRRLAASCDRDNVPNRISIDRGDNHVHKGGGAEPGDRRRNRDAADYRIAAHANLVDTWCGAAGWGVDDPRDIAFGNQIENTVAAGGNFADLLALDAMLLKNGPGADGGAPKRATAVYFSTGRE